MSQRLLPILRAYIAKELIERYGLTQVEVARKLGITQAAVSHYLHNKRGFKELEEFKEVSKVIQSTLREVVEEVRLGGINSDEVALKLCKLCVLMRSKADRQNDGVTG